MCLYFILSMNGRLTLYLRLCSLDCAYKPHFDPRSVIQLVLYLVVARLFQKVKQLTEVITQLYDTQIKKRCLEVKP